VTIKVLRKEALDVIKLAEFTTASAYDSNHHTVDIRAGVYVFINFSKKTDAGNSAAGVS
jgi:hypothetical protein